MIEEQICAYKKARDSFCALLEQKAEAVCLKNRDLSLVCTTGRKTGDPTARAVLNLLELDKRLEKARMDMLDKRKKMAASLNEIQDPDLRKIAILHFYKGFAWPATAVRLGMKTSTAKMKWKRFHDKEQKR